MAGKRSNPRELYRAASSGLAWLAAIATVAFALAFYWIETDVSEGWLRDFLAAALPGAAVVAVAYVIGYHFLIRKGISRDQRLVEAFAEDIAQRSPVAPAVLDFSTHPRGLNWTDLFAEAERITLAGRWFSMWTSEQAVPLAQFFERGGKLTAYMLDPANDSAVRRAAAQHAGFSSSGDAEAAKHKVVVGARRLIRAAQSSPRSNSLAISLIVNPEVTLTQTLFLFEGTYGRRLAINAIDNFRDEGHRSPGFVIDLAALPLLSEFWESERTGFERNARTLEAHELEALGSRGPGESLS